MMNEIFILILIPFFGAKFEIRKEKEKFIVAQFPWLSWNERTNERNQTKRNETKKLRK